MPQLIAWVGLMRSHCTERSQGQDVWRKMQPVINENRKLITKEVSIKILLKVLFKTNWPNFLLTLSLNSVTSLMDDPNRTTVSPSYAFDEVFQSVPSGFRVLFGYLRLQERSKKRQFQL